ncbi:MAG: hypothetical protein H7287_10205, partial [Thermoleophilia bacterium]|nr:hypothetical protein [Thermoleophilia bacterium]
MSTFPSMTALARTHVRMGLSGLFLLCLLWLPSSAHAGNPVSGIWVVPGATQNTITWDRPTDAVAGSTTYKVYRGTVSGSLGPLVGTVTDPAVTYVDTGLVNGTSYYYNVHAVTGAESTDPVQAVTATGVTFPVGRWWDDCNAIVNGVWYLFGGWNGSGSGGNDIVAYDLAKGTQTTITGGAFAMPGNRYWCGADRSNGKVYLLGGGTGTNGATEYNDIYKFDPATGFSLMQGTLPAAESQTAAVTLSDGKIFELGGQNGTTVYNTGFKFDPILDPVGAFTPAVTTTYTNGVGVAGMASLDGNVLVTGGNYSGSGNQSPNNRTKKITMTYGPDSAAESNRTLYASTRLGAGIATLNDRLYSIGGATSASEGTACGAFSCAVVNTIQSFDDRSNAWTNETATIGTGRFRVSAQRVRGYVYFVGGNDGSTFFPPAGTFLSAVQRFDPGGQARGVPGAPRFATAASTLSGTASNHTVALSWTGGSTVDYYRIFRSTTSAVRGAFIEEQMGDVSAPGTSIVDGQLVNGTTYYYTVTAVGYDGHETTATSQISATPQGPKDPTSLGQFESNGVTAIAGGAITVSGQIDNVVLTFDVSHTQNAKTLTPWVELSATGTFTGTCGTSIPGVTFSGSNVAAAVAGTLYPAIVNVTGLTGGTTYFWRACAMEGPDDSYWVARGGAPDFVTDALPDAQLVTPAAGSWTSDSTPALTARHVDANADTGQVQFEVCTTNAASPWSANCGSGYQTFTSAAGLANNATTAWSPAALPSGFSYWRIRSTDSRGGTG